jgi:hypothetical protein
MCLPRSRDGDCSPMHHLMASTMLDLPQPLGPTMQVMSWSKWTVVWSTKDLKPVIWSFLIFTLPPKGVSGRGYH